MSLNENLLEGKPTAAERRAALGKIADLLKRNGIDTDEVGKVHRVSVYQSLTKNDEGEAEIHDLVGIQLSPAWEEGPKWELPNRGPAVRLPARKAKPKSTSGGRGKIVRKINRTDSYRRWRHLYRCQVLIQYEFGARQLAGMK